MEILKILILLICLLSFTTVANAKTQENSEQTRISYMNMTWWKKFNDENLNSNLTKLYSNNQDLKIASIKSQQSQQIMKQAFANQLPQVYFNGNLQRVFTASDEKFGNLVIPDYNQAHYNLPLTMSYEVDIWGENYLKTKSFKKQIEMTKQDEHSSYISISSNFASEYYTLIGLDKLIENQQKLKDLEEQIVKLEVQKYESGLCPLAEVLSEKQTLAQMTERLNSLKERQDVVSNDLFSMLGDRYDTKILRSDYNSITIPSIPSEISTEIIEHRPDIKKAEAYIEKTGIDVKVARRDFLPKFQVYGQVGFNAFDWCRMFAPHTFLSNVGVAPSLYLFTGGLKKARLKYSKLEYEKALQIYEKSILNSIQELNDSLMSYRTSELNHKKSLERYELEQAKLDLANQKYSTGAQSKLENLKYNQKLLLEEADVIMNNINQEIAVINIYKATGGVDFTENL